MTRRALPVVGVLFALALGASAIYAHGAGKPKVYKPGDKIADFAFKSDQGKMVKLSQYRGKVVVINFFATW